MSGEMVNGAAPGFPEIWRVTADNPGPMTLDGTNTYLYGSNPCWVIDPGPPDQGHQAITKEAIEDRGGAAGVLLTHSHVDHAGGAEMLGLPVVEAGKVTGSFRDGMVAADLESGSEIFSIDTPGHSSDHVCFMATPIPGGACFSGDLILGRGFTYVPPDGGSLASYMDSLKLLQTWQPALICPGHGPWITDPAAKISEYLEHRLMRENGLVEAMAAGERSREALLDLVWSDVPEQLKSAARMVMEAHLQKLKAEGRLPDGLVK